jgi:hypothetical protein
MLVFGLAIVAKKIKSTYGVAYRAFKELQEL